MAVSSFSAVSTGGNNFYVRLTGSTTTATVASKPAGDYTLSSSLNDGTKDIYLYAADGSSAGYTGINGITATKDFVKIVILGGTNNDFIFFENVPTYASTQTTSEVTAGPVAISASVSVLESIDDTTTVTGENFADNVTVHFIGQDAVARAAKSVVRGSATSLIATRPDVMPPSASPYSIKISNPGVSDPVGSAVNIISNAITVGAAPVWVTTSPLPSFTKGSAYSTTLSATDADGSVVYSIVSGTLPTGISLNGSTGTLSGTPTTSASVTITVRATDTGGNFVDRAFLLPNPDPVWVTAAGNLTDMTIGSAYSYQLQATNDDTLTYTLASGTLPAGLSLSTSGLISGTPTAGNGAAPFTVRVTDPNGVYVDRSFGIGSPVYVNITSTQSWTAPAGVTTVSTAIIAGGGSGGPSGNASGYSGAGGGAGGVLLQTLSVTPGTAYTITIGAGGAGQQYNEWGNAGNNSSFGALATATGGGRGATAQAFYSAGSGGSGGGCSANNSAYGPGTGIEGQGFSGAYNVGNLSGGGGGAGAAASGLNGGIGKSVSAYNNAGINLIGGGGGGGSSDTSGTGGAGGDGGGAAGGDPIRNGGNVIAAIANYGGGGGGGKIGGWPSGAGGSGRVLIKYLL